MVGSKPIHSCISSFSYHHCKQLAGLPWTLAGLVLVLPKVLAARSRALWFATRVVPFVTCSGETVWPRDLSLMVIYPSPFLRCGLMWPYLLTCIARVTWAWLFLILCGCCWRLEATHSWRVSSDSASYRGSKNLSKTSAH